MHTERFRQLRKNAIDHILKKTSMCNVWRKIVRGQLRRLDIKDIYDHYDFNFNIDDRVMAIRNDIMNGTYKPEVPLVYRIEKKYGICRHMVIPSPADALILQVIVENLADQIISKQPSENAYYSRDKHNVGKIHEGVEYGVPFRKQWKELQKKIYKFHEEKELLIVTDLTNYYDSIYLPELRKVFLSQISAPEVVVDLLFQIIEAISWKPDYLPYSGRGLPTTNLEAIRLLAHSFLFEIDEILKMKTNNSFVRWMDDFTIGVNTKKEAISIICAISDMLKSRGLSLNISKTSILNTEEVEHEFLIKKNLDLDSFEKIETKDIRQIEKILYKKFKNHLGARTSKYWEKVAKRFITVFGRLKSRKILEITPDIYLKYPGLRPYLLLYLRGIGYGKKTSTAILEILKGLSVFDDISLFGISELLTEWEVPVTDHARNFLDEAENAIEKLSWAEPSGFYALLWFKAKYSYPEELYRYLKKYENRWKTDVFLRRQATAVLSRLSKIDAMEKSPLLIQQISSGNIGVVSVANQIAKFEMLDQIEGKLGLYLFPTKKQSIYPLGKFLVLCSVLNSKKIRTEKSISVKIKGHISDPHYRHWLKIQYGMKF